MIENSFEVFNGDFKGLATTKDESKSIISFSNPSRLVIFNLQDNFVQAQIHLTSNISSQFIVDQPGCERFIVLALEDKSIRIYSLCNQQPQLLKVLQSGRELNDPSQVQITQNSLIQNKFIVDNYELDIFNLDQGLESHLSTFILQNLLKNDNNEALNPAQFDYLKSQIYLPSKFSIQSIIPQIIEDDHTQTEETSVIKALINSNVEIIKDSSQFNLISRLYQNHAYKSLEVLGNHLAHSKKFFEISEMDYKIMLGSQQQWMSDLVHCVWKKANVCKSDCSLSKFNGAISRGRNQAIVLTKDPYITEAQVKSQICENSKENQGLIEIFTSPTSFNLTLGSIDNIKFLEGFQSDWSNNECLFHTCNRNLIEIQWLSHFWKITLLLVVTRGLPLVSMVIFLVTLNENFFYACLATSSLCLSYEILHLVLNPGKYFKSYDNWLDLFGHICGISWILARMNLDNQNNNFVGSHEDQFHFLEAFVQIIWTFSITIRASDLFKLFDKTRMLLTIIFISIKHVMPFSYITAYMIFSISVVKNLITYPQSENIMFTTGNLFAYTMGAEFEAPATGADSIPGNWIVFIIMKFIITLVVLNTLIAILGDSFDQVKTDQVSFDTREIINLLLELNQIVFWNRLKVNKQFIQVIKNVSNQTHSANNWEGRIKMILNQIQHLRTIIQQKLDFSANQSDTLKVLTQQTGSNKRQIQELSLEKSEQQLADQNSKQLGEIREFVKNDNSEIKDIIKSEISVMSSDLTMKLQDQKRIIEITKNDNASTAKGIEQMNNQISQLQRQIEMQNSKDQVLLIEKLAKLQVKVQWLSQENQNIAKDNKQINSQYVSTKNMYEENQIVLRALTTQKDELLQLCQDLEDKVEDKDDQIRNLNQVQSEIQKKYSSVVEEKKTLQKQNSEIIKQNEKSYKNLIESNKTIQNLQEMKVHIDELVQNERIQKEEIQLQKQEIEVILQESVKKVGILNEKLEDADASKNQLQKELTSLRQKNDMQKEEMTNHQK